LSDLFVKIQQRLRQPHLLVILGQCDPAMPGACQTGGFSSQQPYGLRHAQNGCQRANERLNADENKSAKMLILDP